VAFVDGNATQIRILERMAKENKTGLTIVVDIIHVIEYLWSAGRVFYPQGSQVLEDWVSHRLEEILKGKAGYVAGGIVPETSKPAVPGPKKKRAHLRQIK